MYTDLADGSTPFKLARLLRDRHLDAFCLNDTDSSASAAADQEALLGDFLPAYLPFRTPFELAHPRPGTTAMDPLHIPVTRGAPPGTERVPAQGERPVVHPSFKENSVEL
jgi:hypothetical protein